MTTSANPPEARRAQRWLAVGLTVVGVIFISQGAVNALVVGQSEQRAMLLYKDSLASIEYLTRIARDVGEERILIDDHIFEQKAVGLTVIEKQLAEVGADIRSASQAYGQLIELPNEARTWQQYQVQRASLERGNARALAFSRKQMDVEARAAMLDVVGEYRELEYAEAALLRINQKGAQDAIGQIAKLQRGAEEVTWASRVLALAVIVLLGLWGTRRIAAYEKQIIEDARALEERNRDLDAFAGRVAHDLRNALGPVALAPALLRRSTAQPARVLEIADRTERFSRRAIAVVDALLAFSRAAKSMQAEESAPLDPILRDVLEELSEPVARLDVSIAVEAIPDVRLRCDPGLLHIVLANLCGNAVKYLEGQPRRCVRISAQQEAAACRIEVEDTGPGIPLDARGKIFEPFYRVEGTRAPGTGIGLATVRRIVDARGGHVAIESVEGQGSRFQLWLPLAPASATPG